MLSKEQQQLAALHEYNFDHPDAFDFDLLISILRKLKEGKSVKVPVYDFTTHSRRKEWVCEAALGGWGGMAKSLVCNGTCLWRRKLESFAPLGAF